jgi:Ca2+-transporting ATPase
MERAFHALGREQLPDAGHSHPHWTLVHAYGLRPDLLAVTHVWQPDSTRQEFIVAAKGAPEAIAGLCHLGAAERTSLTQSIDAMASAGLRVLGVARTRYAGQAWPASPREFAFEFLGLVGLADPLRSSVIEAVRECRSAGIRRRPRRSPVRLASSMASSSAAKNLRSLMTRKWPDA